MGRKTQTWEQINTDTTTGKLILLSQNDYNELGHLQTKHLHSTDSVNFLQDVNYAYNERGWLLNQNSNLFSEQLQYNDTSEVKGISPIAQYNGNIASQTWASSNASNNSYLYSYDRLNRLTSGITADNQFAEQGISYDMAGNINSLSRTYGGINIDNLQYRYNGNQLQSIRDSSPDTSKLGYQGGNGNYTYDGNGNLSQVLTKQGTGSYTTSYNILNLPDTVTTSQGTVTYTYDATGEKLNKTSTIDSVTTTTDYISGIQYTNGKLAFIQTEEGRALPNSGTFNYEYTLADHLGNSRLNFDSEKGYARVNQQDDYLPFGMEISGLYKDPKNEYLYNKKELQEETQLYDYGARFYDPVVARWTTSDPWATNHYDLTPYNYVMNNPMLYGDEFGLDTGKVVQLKEVKITAQKKQKPVVLDLENSWKKAPHLKPLTHWWQKAMAFLNNGRTYNNVRYDNNGNPTGIAPTLMEFPFYITGPGDLEGLNLIFNIVDQEGDLIIYSTEIGDKVITFGGDITKTEDGVLTIKNFDIDGKLTNQLGKANLEKIINQFGKQQGVKEVIIEGAKRTTGANPGRLPAALRFIIK